MSEANQLRIVAETTGRVFTFTIGNVKQLSFKVRLKLLRISADRPLYDREFQSVRLVHLFISVKKTVK